MIDAFASERQYLEHLAPCWQALPADQRGTFYVAHSMMVAASLHGIGPLRDGRPGPGGPVMVASFQDHREARRVGRPVLFIEHGSGQQYQLESGPHPSYSGSPEHEGTILFICPSETVADRWRARYPDVPAVAVGVPKLDCVHAELQHRRLRESSEATGMVLQALFEVASARLTAHSSDFIRRSSLGPLLGEGEAGVTRRLLALAGIEEKAWIRRLQCEWSNPASASRGVVPDLRCLADPGSDIGSHLSQSGPPVRGWPDVCSSDVREPSPPGRGIADGEPASVAIVRGRQGPMRSGSSLDDRIDLRATRWETAVQDMYKAAEGWPSLAARLPAPRARARTLDGATVAISFHCDLALCPETRSAWRHYDPHLPAVVAALRDGGAHVIGHAHPRLFRRVEHRWRECGAEPVGDFATVLARADVYACDNSSTLPEAASCGIPLVWMNAPWWRRDVDHGGRFYRWPAGQVSCDRPADLPGAVVEALADRPEVAAARAAMVAEVYAACDGKAARRAADAVLNVAASL